MYVGAQYNQYDTVVANEKEAFIEYFTEMAGSYPACAAIASATSAVRSR
jgi:predicted SnoaL-like aldol condensation-catalyzing enzyme